MLTDSTVFARESVSLNRGESPTKLGMEWRSAMQANLG
jgi:hypothetical protein